MWHQHTWLQWVERTPWDSRMRHACRCTRLPVEQRHLGVGYTSSATYVWATRAAPPMCGLHEQRHLGVGYTS